MASLALAFRGLARAVAGVWRDPETKALPFVAEDLHPTSAGTQIFTIFYILTGIGVFVALLASVAQQYIAQKAESPSARERLSARRHRGQTD